MNLARTQSDILHSTAAPVAYGRSGRRKEKGLSTTGLLGENLKIGERSTNTFVQRSWMYANDPALTYKTQGIPTASIPDGVSLDIGEHEGKQGTIAIGETFHRRQLITNGPLTRSVKSGKVFLDYPWDN